MKVEIREGFPDVGVIINCPQATAEVRKMVSILQGLDEKLSGMKDGYTHMIDRQDIFYFEAVDRRYFIYTEKDAYETHLRLYEIEDSLSDAGFFRSSKSQIINISKIASLCPDFDGRVEVVMGNGEKLIVSRQYAKQLKERLGLK